MAKKRKFCAYRKLERPYTRKSRYRKKDFIRASPPSKIVRFDMGNNKKADWDYTLCLVSKDWKQIRDTAIESARQVCNKQFETKIGVDNYRLRVKAYPHHMLRENPLASGAGADRMSTGMQMSFGKVIGIAAQIKKGKVLFEISTTKEFLDDAKAGLSKARHKMPGSFTIETIDHAPAKK